MHTTRLPLTEASSLRNHRRGRHLTYVTYGGPHYCLTCGVTVGPTWQAKAAHAGVLRKDKTP